MSHWTIDPMHSEVQFKVKHLVISTVTGSFSDFEGTLEGTPDQLEQANIHFSAKVASYQHRQRAARQSPAVCRLF